MAQRASLSGVETHGSGVKGNGAASGQTGGHPLVMSQESRRPGWPSPGRRVMTVVSAPSQRTLRATNAARAHNYMVEKLKSEYGQRA